MTRISFEGFNNQYATFIAEEGMTSGTPVLFDEGNACYEAQDGDAFTGICTETRNGLATVLLQGYYEIKYSGTAPGYGYQRLIANGAAGVKLAGDEDEVPFVRVLKVDGDKKTVGFIL